uniref:Ig-like domain-containing protein n=1 Tax=Bubo bubo TaxID=30461 RepID=A0A8C0FNZ2_BUBBB
MAGRVWHVVTQSPSLAEQHSKANLEEPGTTAVLACSQNRKPTFTQGLKCRSVLEGNPALFQCKLVACPAPHMSWFHNNRPVHQDCRKVIRTESEEHTHHASLEVRDVREHDEEEEVSLAFATVQGLPSVAQDSDLLSLPVEIKITAPTPTPEQDTEMRETTRPSPNQAAPTIKHKEKTLEFEPEKPVYSSNAKMKMEEGARLSVTVTGSPTPKIHWFFNRMKLTPSMDCKLVFAGNDHSLILPYAGVQDEGEYRCVASNVHGETTCSAHLHVRQRIPGVPCFTREPDSVRCAPGFTAVFEYTVAGEPCPDVQWFKGTEQMSFVNSVAVLDILEMKVDDSGSYSCEAVNEVGSDSCATEVPPSFIRTLEPAEVVKGTNTVLQCEVAGTGPFEISWYKDKKQIRSSKKYRLTSQKAVISLAVSSFNSADVGEYECMIANEVGKCICSATYILKGQDCIPLRYPMMWASALVLPASLC